MAETTRKRTPRKTANGVGTPEDLSLAVMSRFLDRYSALEGLQYGGARDLYQTLGYQRSLRYDDFAVRMLRNPIAFRVVKAYPMDTWRHPPAIREKDNEEKPAPETPFELEWEVLVDRLKVYARLEQGDRLANIGRYSALVVGLGGQTSPNQLAIGQQEVIHLTPFSEKFAEIEQLENDPASPNFGRPVLYKIKAGRKIETTRGSPSVPDVLVHASRVIHMVEDLVEDQVYGVPRLMPIWNTLDDLEKVSGGSAEAFWLTAVRGIVAKVDNDFQFDTEQQRKAVETAIADFTHKMSRWIMPQGFDVQSLANEVAKPAEHFDMLIAEIAGATGIPQRILLGSERGSLASEQDTANWNSRIMARQAQYAEPVVLRPLIDRFIVWDILPEPSNGYTVIWPDLFSLGAEEESVIENRHAQTVKTLADALFTGVSPLSLEEMREFLGLEAEMPEIDEPILEGEE